METLQLILSSISLHETRPVPPAHRGCCSHRHNALKCVTDFELLASETSFDVQKCFRFLEGATRLIANDRVS